MAKKEKAICNKCGTIYRNKKSIELVKKWQKDGYAPCPNISCSGQMEVIESQSLYKP